MTPSCYSLASVYPATIAEMSFALDELRADGIALASSYGEGSDACLCFHLPQAVFAE